MLTRMRDCGARSRSFAFLREGLKFCCHDLWRTLVCIMIIVTGGSGKAGRACISELLAHNYEVASVDLVRPSDVPVPFSRVELTDFGQTIEAFSQIDDRIR